MPPLTVLRGSSLWVITAVTLTLCVMSKLSLFPQNGLLHGPVHLFPHPPSARPVSQIEDLQ